MDQPDQIARLIGALGVFLAALGLFITYRLNRPRVKLSTELIKTGPNWSVSGVLQLTVHITNNTHHPIWAEAAYFGSRWGDDSIRVIYSTSEHSRRKFEHSDQIKIEPFQSDYFLFLRNNVKEHPGLDFRVLEDADIQLTDTLTIEAPLGVKHRIRNAHIRQFAKGKS